MAATECEQIGRSPTPALNWRTLATALPLVAILIVYAWIEYSLYATHVPWRDEGQAWFWAQALSSPIDFFVVPGEGHPPLWYWLLRVLSVFLNFDQARFATVIFAVANATLILLLLRREPLLACLLVFSAMSVQYWGYNFRPYVIVLTLTLMALWCDRSHRPLAATWLMALTCGFHFFSGFLFAFWLTVAWRRGLRVKVLLPPVLLALFFAALVFLSGHGNASYKFRFDRVLYDAATLLGTPFSEEFYPPVVAAGVVVLLSVFIFRRDRLTLLFFLGTAVSFCVFGTIVYGREDWHLAYLVVLLIMAYVTTGAAFGRWPMLFLLFPGLVMGLLAAAYNISVNPRTDQHAYFAIAADAGGRLDPTHNLVSWPDFPLLGQAARYKFRFVSANNGAIVGPVNLQDRKDWQLDLDLLKTLPRPYWLYCLSCNSILHAITLTDRHATMLYASDPNSAEPVGAFRID